MAQSPPSRHRCLLSKDDPRPHRGSRSAEQIERAPCLGVRRRRRSASISRKCGWSAMRTERIVEALNEPWRRCTSVFTTGGTGPTHGDITADCVAKAFGVPIDTDTRALAILHEWVKTTGAKMNEARLRMTRIPKGVVSFSTRCRGRGFWIGNVIVLAGARPKQIGGPAHAGPRQIVRPKGGGSGGLRAHRHEVSDTVT